MTLIEHLESHLGEIGGGWKGNNLDDLIQVVSFENQPFDDINTYSTLGLNNYELPMNSGKPIRQELVFTAYKNFIGEKVASFLLTFAESIVSFNKALLRGDVIGPNTPIIPGSTLNSIFAAVPMIFEESFFVFEDKQSEIVFPWIIPIHEDEANYTRTLGWQAFEEKLEQKNPELWDLQRVSIL